MKKIIIITMISLTMFATASIPINAKILNDTWSSKEQVEERISQGKSPYILNGWKANKDGKWQYYNNDELKIGWLNIGNNKWYYFGEDGIMAKGTQCINNNWYYFYEDGVMAHDVTLGGCVFNSNGVLIQTKVY